MNHLMEVRKWQFDWRYFVPTNGSHRRFIYVRPWLPIGNDLMVLPGLLNSLGNSMSDREKFHEVTGSERKAEILWTKVTNWMFHPYGHFVCMLAVLSTNHPRLYINIRGFQGGLNTTLWNQCELAVRVIVALLSFEFFSNIALILVYTRAS